MHLDRPGLVQYWNIISVEYWHISRPIFYATCERAVVRLSGTPTNRPDRRRYILFDSTVVIPLQFAMQDRASRSSGPNPRTVEGPRGPGGDSRRPTTWLRSSGSCKENKTWFLDELLNQSLRCKITKSCEMNKVFEFAIGKFIARSVSITVTFRKKKKDLTSKKKTFYK